MRNRTHQTQDKPDKPRKPQSKMVFASSNSDNVNATSTDCDSSGNAFRNEPKCASNIDKRNNVSECFYCSKAGHLIYSCYKFIVESLEKRIKFASDKNLCFSCLRFAHGNSRCPVRSSPRLPQCRKNHHALLCSYPSEGKDMSSKPIHDTKNETSCKKVSVGVNQIDNAVGVRLHVLPIVISNECGDEKEVYAMFDSGSEESLISAEIADFLSLNGDPIDITMLTADGRSLDIIRLNRLT